MATLTLDPVTRIEGHLKVDVTIENVNGIPQVIDARSAGTMFRGFENMLIGRDPRDAVHYTQRICGVCPVSHGIAAALNLESATGLRVPENARIMRNLILGANFLQSHILHFYHLAALDYIDTSGLLDVAPWVPRNTTPDMLAGQAAADLVSHYVSALAIRRKAHHAGAVFAGKLPCMSTVVAGGVTESVTAEKIAIFRATLDEIRGFIENTYIRDAMALAAAFPQYYSLGAGPGNLLAYGAFDLDSAGQNKLFPGGRYTAGALQTMNPGDITEDVLYSRYTPDSGGINPAAGVTVADAYKPGAYSWVKSPRYLGQPHELGPLARMWISGEYTRGISAMDRIVARALEAHKLATAMDGWLNELTPGRPTYQHYNVPATGAGMGLIEAPRGALGHWITIAGGRIARYQVVTPTSWNASPMDDVGRPGPIEQALIGTPVADLSQPVELLRIVHSFDPCLACSVHVMRTRS